MKKLFAVIILTALCTGISAQNAEIYNGDTINKRDAKNLKTGKWRTKVDNMYAVGTYVNDLKEGQWLGYHTGSGRLILVENYFYGKKNGLSLVLNENGTILEEIYYKDDVLEGNCRYFDSERLKSEVSYKNGKVNGSKRMFYDTGKLQEESQYIDDIRNGEGRWYYTSGRLSTVINYKNGGFEGMQTSYYENGNTLSEQNFKNNVEEGEYKEYFEKGQMKIQGMYKNGKKEGEWKEFDENAKLIKTTVFKGGEEVKKKK
ncbi:MAG: toxin-antitoxin system YwqK family antitoxin [Bacteroidales bacterium]|nr:toxin-antitoxin system YwqK family antitoxin [Bacteroidales bacterium]